MVICRAKRRKFSNWRDIFPFKKLRSWRKAEIPINFISFLLIALALPSNKFHGHIFPFLQIWAAPNLTFDCDLVSCVRAQRNVLNSALKSMTMTTSYSLPLHLLSPSHLSCTCTRRSLLCSNNTEPRSRSPSSSRVESCASAWPNEMINRQSDGNRLERVAHYKRTSLNPVTPPETPRVPENRDNNNQNNREVHLSVALAQS